MPSHHAHTCPAGRIAGALQIAPRKASIQWREGLHRANEGDRISRNSLEVSIHWKWHEPSMDRPEDRDSAKDDVAAQMGDRGRGSRVVHPAVAQIESWLG